MEYLGRTIILDIENNDWDSATENYQKAVKIWDVLQMKLNDSFRNIIDYGNQTKSLLQQSIKSKDAKKTTTILKDVLEKVDALKADYIMQMNR